MNEKEVAVATTATASQNGNGNFIAQQKEKLEEEKKILLEEREGLINPRKVAFHFEGDPAWELRIRRIGEKLNAIEIALLRIKNNAYLTCVKCGGAIESPTLIACPARRICCACMPPEPPKKRHRY